MLVHIQRKDFAICMFETAFRTELAQDNLLCHALATILIRMNSDIYIVVLESNNNMNSSLSRNAKHYHNVIVVSEQVQNH